MTYPIFFIYIFPVTELQNNINSFISRNIDESCRLQTGYKWLQSVTKSIIGGIKLQKINLVILKETTYQKPTELYGVVKKCVICGSKHIHSAEEGNVVAHCINLNVPTTYELVIDRNDENNLQLARKYALSLN